jgi:hypothetical protein
MSDVALERALPSSRVAASAHQHSVQFYETDAFLVEAVANFIATGLGAGEPAVLLTLGVFAAGKDFPVESF